LFIPALPKGCIRHFGPFTSGCLERIYDDAGCLPEGWANPHNISSGLLYEEINTMDIRLEKFIFECVLCL